MNRIITPDQMAADVLAAMQKAEDEAGIPRGSIVKAWVKEFNKQFDETVARWRSAWLRRTSKSP